MGIEDKIEELEERNADLARRVAELEGGKSCHPEVTSENVGRLVMVRDSGYNDWLGPFVLKKVRSDSGLKYMAGPSSFNHAKLYTGPTLPNWNEHDGLSVPADVYELGQALIQDRSGDVDFVPAESHWWVHGCRATPNDIMRYTIIEA